MKLSIITISFNGGDTLIELISDLILEKERERKMDIEIVVVDNGSTQKNKEQITNNKIKIIENGENLGFAAGCNIGIKYALESGSDAVLLLNQDVIIGPGFINKLLTNPSDIVSPVIKFRRGDEWIYDYGGQVNWWIGRTKHIESANQQINQLSNQPIDYVSGCCMLVKRAVFGEIGFFDEKFFMYFEDVDFCIRAQRAGFRLAVEQKTIIIHNLIEGSQKSFSSQRELLKSNFIFMNKYLGFKRIFGYLYLLVLFKKICLNKLLRQLS